MDAMIGFVVVAMLCLVAYYAMQQTASTSSGTGTGKLLGCYGDSDARTMSATTTQNVSPEQCAAAARAAGHRYMGLQAVDGSGNSQCFSSNDLQSAMKLGVRSPCNAGGGPWVNAVYDLNA